MKKLNLIKTNLIHINPLLVLNIKILLKNHYIKKLNAVLKTDVSGKFKIYQEENTYIRT